MASTTDGGDPSAQGFQDAVSLLYSTISSGAALEEASRQRRHTVEAMRLYMDRIQLDISGLSVIHVTGTKGKGSTCAFVESILRKGGVRTGLFTSPHLVKVTERIRIDGRPISEQAFARHFFEVWARLQNTAGPPPSAGASANPETPPNPAPAENDPSPHPYMPNYFRLLTLLGLWVFVQEGVDVAIVEVGVGGRFDATNVVEAPAACGVTTLDLDHVQVLGSTLPEIAWEKGGIYKRGCPALSVAQPPAPMEVLRQCAAEVGAALEEVAPLSESDGSGDPIQLGLQGPHQRINAGLAVRLCQEWHRQRGRELCVQAAEVREGLRACRWPGRCQILRPASAPGVTLYLDGAHTEQSVRICRDWFWERSGADAAPGSKVLRCLIFNASHERDVGCLLKLLAGTGDPQSRQFERVLFLGLDSRPSRFALPSAGELLAAAGIQDEAGRATDDPETATAGLSASAEALGPSGKVPKNLAWQATLEQVWRAIQHHHRTPRPASTAVVESSEEAWQEVSRLRSCGKACQKAEPPTDRTGAVCTSGVLTDASLSDPPRDSNVQSAQAPLCILEGHSETAVRLLGDLPPTLGGPTLGGECQKDSAPQQLPGGMQVATDQSAVQSEVHALCTGSLYVVAAMLTAAGWEG